MANFSKVGKSSRRKGGAYERRVAKLLTELTKVDFRRVPGSGGFNKQAKEIINETCFAGDICCSNEHQFLFLIEAKNRKEFSFTKLLFNPNKGFSDWWYQCVKEANDNNLLPAMIFKPDRGKDFIVFDKRGVNKLGINKISNFVIDVYKKKVIVFDYKTKQDLKVKLPVPYVFNWPEFANKVNVKRMFKNGLLRKKQSTS